MKKYDFSTYAYLAAHGKAPKGTGHWAFTIDGAELPNIAPETYVDRLPFNVPMTVFWVPGVWTLTEAKKRAAVMLEACAVPFGTTIEVAP